MVWLNPALTVVPQSCTLPPRSPDPNRCPAPSPPLLQVPRSCQCMLMSATVSDEVEKLNKLILHSPAVLNLLDAGKADGLAAGSGERARGGKGGESGEGA